MSRLRDWLGGPTEPSKEEFIESIRNLKFPRQSKDEIVITGTEGTIHFLNGSAQKYMSAKKGDNFFDRLEGGSRKQLENILEFSERGQPYLATRIHTKGRNDARVLKCFRDEEAGILLFIMEDFQTNQEILALKEELLWMKRLRLLVFGISHEIKTPLATARGYAEIIQGDHTGVGPQKVISALDRISAILQELTYPLDDIEEKDPEASDPGRNDIADQIEDLKSVIPFMDSTKRYTGDLTVETEDGRGATIKLPKARFFQMLMNLIENSIDAIHEKGVKGDIKVCCHTCDTHSKCIKMTVSDNGVGMTEETQKKMYSPYFTTKEEDGGSGLGGYFIKQFIEEVDGEIEVDSKLGLGTTFTIHLPTY